MTNKITITTSGIIVLIVLSLGTFLFYAQTAETASATSVVKSVDETVVGENLAVQDDDELVLPLSKNRTYIIDGVVYIDYIANGEPNAQKIAFTVPVGSVMKIGYSDSHNQISDILDTSGEIHAYTNSNTSNRRAVIVKGIVRTGNQDGNLTFQWSHESVGDALTTVEAGSFLRADQI